MDLGICDTHTRIVRKSFCKHEQGWSSEYQASGSNCAVNAPPPFKPVSKLTLTLFLPSLTPTPLIVQPLGHFSVSASPLF